MTVLHDLSQLLNTGLSREQLRACVELIESGVNAEAVAVSSNAESNWILRRRDADQFTLHCLFQRLATTLSTLILAAFVLATTGDCRESSQGGRQALKNHPAYLRIRLA